VPGSVGNEVDLLVAAKDGAPVAGDVSVALVDSPLIATNVRIREADADSADGKVFTISFDIPRSAEAGASETLRFDVSSEEFLFFERSSVEFHLKVVAGEGGAVGIYRVLRSAPGSFPAEEAGDFIDGNARPVTFHDRHALFLTPDHTVPDSGFFYRVLGPDGAEVFRGPFVSNESEPGQYEMVRAKEGSPGDFVVLPAPGLFDEARPAGADGNGP
jgi:hypothetical protein